MKSYIYILLIIISTALFGGCREDDLVITGQEKNPESNLIEFEVNIIYPNTRGVFDESKKSFETGELLHIRAEFDCSRNGEIGKTDVQYGILKYSGKGKWTAFDSAHTMYWPDEAVSGTFTAYYINGSNGALSSNTMEPVLLSDFAYGEEPLYGETKDISYGTTVRLDMSHVFAHLTLTEMNNDVPGELWFTVPKSLQKRNDNGDLDEPVFNNAFYLEFDEDTKMMSHKFTQVPNTLYKDEGYSDSDYKDENGDEKYLVYISSSTEQYETEDGHIMTRCHFFLEPREYHKFALQYSRSHTEYSTYLSYNRDLSNVLALYEEEKLMPNGTYEFSVLKSLGVVVEEEPDDNWDDDSAPYEVDVEEFLKAAATGSEYWVDVEGSDERVEILEPTMNGTRLLKNIDFKHSYYYVFEDGYVPNLSNTLDGNYHYIVNTACPLFNQNQGSIINLGLKDIKTPIIESNENFPLSGGGFFDTSYNGLICCRNNGIVRNMRVVNAEMTVAVRTSDDDEPTQEAHNAALLFGVNRGSVSNINLSGNFSLKVTNAEGEDIMPNVMIGGLTGQNLGTISGIGSIDAEGFSSPSIKIKNICKGANGVYLVGGVTGLNPGILDDIYLASVEVDGSGSVGVESRIGGIVGEIPNSNTGSPEVRGCIIRGSISAGEVNSLTNVNSLTYAGGFAGSLNLQGVLENNSVSISVTGSSYTDAKVTYATGGAFGRIEKSLGTSDGNIYKLAAFGSVLTGVSEYIGNFAGIVPPGYGWNYYQDRDIAVRQAVNDNVGIEM